MILFLHLAVPNIGIFTIKAQDQWTWLQLLCIHFQLTYGLDILS